MIERWRKRRYYSRHSWAVSCLFERAYCEKHGYWHWAI